MKNIIKSPKVKGFFADFRSFAVKGNMIDLAVGVVIGTAFGKIISSLVNDIIMPPLGLLLGKINFNNLFISLSGGSYETLEAAKAAGASTLNYGAFIQNTIDFLIIAFCIFIVVKQLSRLKKAPVPAEPTEKKCQFCFSNINIAAKKCPFCTADLNTLNS